MLKYTFATAVSFTVEETLQKMKKANRRKWDLVIEDAFSHFDYDLLKIVKSQGFKFLSDYNIVTVEGTLFLNDKKYNPKVFLNIGPGKILDPITLDVGDALLSHDTRYHFRCESRCVLIYKELTSE